MSLGLPTITQIEFDAQVKAAYQNAGILRPHVRSRNNIVGGTHRFRRANRIVAGPRIPQTDVTPSGQTYGEAIATLTDWIAADFTDNLDQALTNVEERSVLATNIGAAIGRRVDQMIIDALDAANGSPNIAASGTGLTYDKIRRAKALMDQRGVPLNQRKLVMSARGLEDLLGESRFTSRDFIEGEVVRTGQMPPILGFTPLMIEERLEGGLPLATTTRTCFAFDMQAVGIAFGVESPLEVNYIPEKTSWLSLQMVKAGAVTIDTLGVIEIATVEAP
jgi:hypothetical protein